MKKKNEFFIYTCMWVIAIAVLLVLLMQNLGDARIVNYSGIVRGATQKLVKEELCGLPNDKLISQLDGIIDNLQTGVGEYDLRRNGSADYQAQLAQIKQTWALMKEEIYEVRSGAGSGEELFQLSQTHFREADKMVQLAEQSSERKLSRFICIYAAILLLSVCCFTALNHKNRRALEHSIYTDNLTGILNRAGFEANATALLRQRTADKYCLVEFDIDDFKFLNSSCGYETGDKLLRALADSLQKRYHTEQLCARVDADDFVILSKKSPKLMTDLRELLAETVLQEKLPDISEFVTFTIGGYEISERSEVIQSAMDKANMAHKDAKTRGKSVTSWYNEKLLEKLNRENLMKNRMRRALDSGEFKMYLQPKYRLSDLGIHSAEALVRWEIPEYGLVAPDQFIPLFEQNGSIAELDFYMLKQACGFVKKHIEEYEDDFSVSVNFSRVTIYQKKFYSTLMGIVDRYEIPHRCIVIEITESAFTEISNIMLKKLLRLQKNGFIISVDDFGSGYSSLNLLDHLPIQELKLDQGFLREYGHTDRAKHVISCVIELAHALEIKVVCEGIEQPEHLEFLQEIHCDIGQGYYFSRPIPQAEFSEKYQLTAEGLRLSQCFSEPGISGSAAGSC